MDQVGGNSDPVIQGLDQIDGLSDMDDREATVESFQALTESRSETERGPNVPIRLEEGR